MQLSRNIKYVTLQRTIESFVTDFLLQYYHSLHARGEKVEDVLRKVDEADGQVGSAEEDLMHEADTLGEVPEHGEMSVSTVHAETMC